MFSNKTMSIHSRIVPVQRHLQKVLQLSHLTLLNTYIDFKRKLVSVVLKPMQTFLVDIKLWIAQLKSFQQVKKVPTCL